MPLQYPLLFPNGDYGFQLGLRKHGSLKNITLLEYGKYRLFQRYEINHITKETSWLHMGGDLFQQYLVDSYAMVEQNNLNFLRHNQTKIRAESYQG